MSSVSLKRLLFLALRVGNLTFGGGEPTMAVFQRELVSRNGWLQAEQYGLSFGLARMTPGTNVLAFCAGVGWQILGWRGALAVVLAVSLPSAALVVILTWAYEAWRANPFATGIISGVVAAAVGMTAAAAWLLIQPLLKQRTWLRSVVVVAGSMILFLALSLPPVPVLALAAILGFFWPEPSRI
jgi:chromate transporter